MFYTERKNALMAAAREREETGLKVIVVERQGRFYLENVL